MAHDRGTFPLRPRLDEGLARHRRARGCVDALSFSGV